MNCKHTYHIIYKTTCLTTGRFYVGMHSTNDLADRYVGSGNVLRASMKKHRPENHKTEILEHHPTREHLVIREKDLVTKNNV